MHSPFQQLLTGPFTRKQAETAGISRKRLATMVRDRTVRTVLYDVYASADLLDTVEVRVQAAGLVVRPWVVVVDRTAAWLHGVDVFDYRELEILPPVETCVHPGRPRVRRRNCRGGERDLAERDIQRIGDLWVTTPLRTALDLGCALSRRSALACLDAFLRLGCFQPQDLRRELPRYRGRRGVVQLRELVMLADAGAESSGESWTRLCIIDAGLPPPYTQWPIEADGRTIFRLDLAYPRHRVCVEYDGEEFHSSAEARQHDEARRQWLRDHGWTVIVVGKHDFDATSVSRWTKELAVALGQ